MRFYGDLLPRQRHVKTKSLNTLDIDRACRQQRLRPVSEQLGRQSRIEPGMTPAAHRFARPQQMLLTAIIHMQR